MKFFLALLLLFLLPLEAAQVVVVKEGLDNRSNDGFSPMKQTVFSCVLKAVNAEYEFHRRPLTRHMRELSQGPFDISFPVSSRYVLKTGEILSAPLALEEWYWVMHSKMSDGVERPSIEKASIAVIQGSEEEAWLTAMGVAGLRRVFDMDQLIKLFSKGRVDLLLIDRETLKELALDMGLDITPYFFKFERYVSFSALFSKAIMTKRPELIKKFNESIPSCATEDELLDPAQRILIKNYAKEVFQKIVNLDSVKEEQTRKVENLKLDHTEISKLEKKWSRPNSKLATALLSNPISKDLKKEILKNFQYVKEVLIFDKSSLLLGAGEKATDYYQGDESKYSETFSKGHDLFFDRLRFDESSKRFLVQVSMMKRSKEKNHKDLAITIGIDVSSFLHDLKQHGAK